MSAAKHTPGPWVVDTEGRAPWVWIGDFAVHVPSFEDARLIAAAPELLKALQGLEMFGPRAGEGYDDTFERVAEVFHRETGYLRPGKDCVLHSSQTRGAVWDDWIAKRRAAARAAIAKATGSAS